MNTPPTRAFIWSDTSRAADSDEEEKEENVDSTPIEQSWINALIQLGYQWMKQSPAVVGAHSSSARMPYGLTKSGKKSGRQHGYPLPPHFQDIESEYLPSSIRSSLEKAAKDFLSQKAFQHPHVRFAHYQKQLYRDFLWDSNPLLQKLREQWNELLGSDISKRDMQRLQMYDETVPKARDPLFTDAALRRKEYMRSKYPDITSRAEEQRKRLWRQQVRKPMDMRAAAWRLQQSQQPTWSPPGNNMSVGQFESLYLPREAQRQSLVQSARRPFI
jgi:hypothetical protein